MKSYLSTLLLLLISMQLSSQNRAPSCWLKYQDHFEGDIIVNTVRVQSPSPTYTYFCTLQWNAGMEGGGYCGIQEHPDGRNFIFSIWDPKASNEAITAPYTHSSTEIENFGGEGTGLKSWNFGIGWETDQWYTFVARAWDSNAHTMFGYWVYNHFDSIWYHLVTMDYPVPNVRFASSTGTFIEDWLGNGSNAREVHHKEGWKRKSSDLSWSAFTSAYFERVSPDAGADNYIDNYDGGLASDHYFMKSGGTTQPDTNESGTTISLSNSNSDPGFAAPKIEQLTTDYEDDILSLAWENDALTSPQFYYKLKIYDNPKFTGSPLTISEISPQTRSIQLDMSSLDDNTHYYFLFNIKDIFDQNSGSLSGSFIKGTPVSIEKSFDDNEILVYPNPFDDEIHIRSNHTFSNVSIELLNILGEVIFKKESESSSEIRIPLDVVGGVYFLNVYSDTDSRSFKLLKREVL